MDLQLTVIEKPDDIVIEPSTRVFSKTGGIIGRSKQCDWHIQDPQRVISSRHARITYASGQYLLTDESTNGLIINDSDDPLGRGNQALLKPGDCIQFAGITVTVTLALPDTGLSDSTFAPALLTPPESQLSRTASQSQSRDRDRCAH